MDSEKKKKNIFCRRQLLLGAGTFAGTLFLEQLLGGGTRKAHGSVLGEAMLPPGVSHPYRQRYAMIVHQERCTGCRRCIEACGRLHLLPEGGQRLTVFERRQPGADPSFLPVMCGHCLDAPCLPVCPTRAAYRDENTGLVLMKEALCVGCRACQTACPYNARYFNPRNQAMDHCDFCYHSRLREARGEPACVEACPNGALVFGDLLDAESAVSRLLAERQNRVRMLRPEKGTRSNLLYL